VALKTRRADGPFGMVVDDLDLAEPLDDGDIGALKALWAEHAVLVFPRQCLTEAELATFSARFGALDVVVRTDMLSPYMPEVIYISNMKDKDGRNVGGLASGEVDWHADQSYRPKPATGAVLYGVLVPPEAGNTYFANQYLAYENLPQALKDRIEGKQAIFSYAHRMAKFYPPEMRDNTSISSPDISHPMVLRHPVSGRKALYADPTTLLRIEGMERGESDDLLAEITGYSVDPSVIYTHCWRPGDVVMWDNGCTLHRRDPLDEIDLRLLKRTTMFLSPEHYCVPD